ncbi:MAG: ATP-grasp domain-containing protein [Asgard group archaeon]|nr:ATP-grasp domain-containing protein [Asgard group archaeon]
MRIFILEFASSGGLVDKELSGKLLVEGFGILRVLIENYKKLGFSVLTALDERLSFLKPFLATDEIILISNKNAFRNLPTDFTHKCDYSIIIAPGTDGILSSLVALWQINTCQSLNSRIDAIDFCTDKTKVYKLCSELKINYPKTYQITSKGHYTEITKSNAIKGEDWRKEINELFDSYPVILKQIDGVACENIFLCTNNEQAKQAFESSLKNEMLLQEYIKGNHLSITANVIEGNITILSLNQQFILLNYDSSQYSGGICNIKHALENEIKIQVNKILKAIPGLNGIIGIDLVITQNGKHPSDIYLIEINPRPTTPICGLLHNRNNPISFHSLKSFDTKRNYLGYFAKGVKKSSAKLTALDYNILSKQENLITPPLSFQNHEYHFLMRGIGKTVREAKRDFKRNQRFLSNKLKKE